MGADKVNTPQIKAGDIVYDSASNQLFSFDLSRHEWRRDKCLRIATDDEVVYWEECKSNLSSLVSYDADKYLKLSAELVPYVTNSSARDRLAVRVMRIFMGNKETLKDYVYIWVKLGEFFGFLSFSGGDSVWDYDTVINYAQVSDLLGKGSVEALNGMVKSNELSVEMRDFILARGGIEMPALFKSDGIISAYCFTIKKN